MAKVRQELERLTTGLSLVALLAVTALAYAPSLHGSFVLDDWSTVQGNMALRRPDALRVPSIADLLGTARPVTEATLVLDWRAAGLDPRRYHVVGLALHLATVAVAFAFLLRLLLRAGHPRPRSIALVASALFALHPIQVESVAYVSQRAEVLASLLYLVTLLLLDESARRWRSFGGALAWAGGAGSWVVAMGAKAIAISLPAAFLLEQAIVAPPRQHGLRPTALRALRALALAAPLLALAAWSASLQFRSFDAQPGGGAGFTSTPLTPGQYFMTQLRVQWLYLRLLAWPRGFAFDRSFEPSLSPDAPVLAAALGVAALVSLALWLWIRGGRHDDPAGSARLCAFGILFWFVALSPTSSIVPVMDVAVEHRVYLASLGAFLAAVVAIDGLIHRWLRPRPARLVLAVAAGAASLALGTSLRARAGTWSSAEAIWRSAAEASPGSARILMNLGLVLRQKGDLSGAESAYRRAWAVARKPETIVQLSRNHAALLVAAGRPAEALEVLDGGLAVSPGDGELRANRAAALATAGRPADALHEARLAVAAAPGDPRTHVVLGEALSANGDWTAGLAEFRQAAAIDPDVPLYRISVAIALAELGRREDACAAFRDAAARSGAGSLPRDAAARAAALGCPLDRNPAAALVDSGRAAEALALLDRALAVSPGDAGLRANRAAALGQLGRHAEALEEARRAAAAAPGDPRMRNVLGQALTVNGDWVAALAEFQAAEALDPANSLYPVSAGISLAALGRRDEACKAFRRAGARSGAPALPLDAAGRAAALGCPIQVP